MAASLREKTPRTGGRPPEIAPGGAAAVAKGNRAPLDGVESRRMELLSRAPAKAGLRALFHRLSRRGFGSLAEFHQAKTGITCLRNVIARSRRNDAGGKNGTRVGTAPCQHSGLSFSW